MAHSSLGLSVVDCAAPRAWQGLPLGVLVNGGHQSGAGQDKEPRFLPWLVTQKYYLSKPPLVTSGPTPQASVGVAQSTAKSPRLLWATEWVKSLWLLWVSPLAGVRYLLMIEIRAGFNLILHRLEKKLTGKLSWTVLFLSLHQLSLVMLEPDLQVMQHWWKQVSRQKTLNCAKSHKKIYKINSDNTTQLLIVRINLDTVNLPTSDQIICRFEDIYWVHKVFLSHLQLQKHGFYLWITLAQVKCK